MDSYSKLSKNIAKNFKCFEISQIVNRQKRLQKQILLSVREKKARNKGKFAYHISNY
jgi:hypothetical protein